MIRNVVPREREIGELFIKGRNSHCRENQLHTFCWQFEFMTPSSSGAPRDRSCIAWDAGRDSGEREDVANGLILCIASRQV